ncbi:MAG: GatB/YqeY domain-containing protein [Chloroflexi bacterium]|nr:GatB/YqeY domain-containing protein [Chloroflexota bacterium]MBL7062419.1 GatB/YqeY domain-containing protein [Dehalococcoidia bacterium]
MTTVQKIRTDLEQSLRKEDKRRCLVLRSVLASIRNAEIAQQKDLDDSGILGVIDKEAKMRHESIEAFEKGNRPDLVANEKAELAILLEYLPEQMSREEIVATARKVISELGATSLKDKGKVMSQLMPQLRGRAQGQEVSDVASELLSST